MPAGLSNVHFLKLTLTDDGGQTVSDNFYWLSKEYDFTDLNKLPRVTLDGACEYTAQGEETVARVKLKNPSETLAFSVHLAVLKGDGGDEVTPTYWEPNYFSLLPGEERIVTATFATRELGETKPVVVVDGYNVARKNL